MTFSYTETLTGDDGTGATVTCTVTRSVYATDARSVHLRAMLAYRNDFHGVALWALGNDDDATWDALAAAQRGEATWPTATADEVPPTSM